MNTDYFFVREKRKERESAGAIGYVFAPLAFFAFFADK